MMKDLRHCKELTECCRILDCERCEIGAKRLHLGKERAHPFERGAAGKVQRIVRVDPPPDRIVELGAVHAEMDTAHAQAIGAHGGG